MSRNKWIPRYETQERDCTDLGTIRTEQSFSAGATLPSRGHLLHLETDLVVTAEKYLTFAGI